MFFGLIIIAIGLYFLLSNLGIISVSFGAVFWPALLIIIGLWMITKKRRFHRWREWRHYGDHLHDDFRHFHKNTHEKDEKGEEEQS